MVIRPSAREKAASHLTPTSISPLAGLKLLMPALALAAKRSVCASADRANRSLSRWGDSYWYSSW